MKKLQSTDPELIKKINDLEKGRDDIEKYIKKNKKELQKRYPNVARILTVTRKKMAQTWKKSYKDITKDLRNKKFRNQDILDIGEKQFGSVKKLLGVTELL